MKKRGNMEGIIKRTRKDGSTVFSATLSKSGHQFDRRFPTLEAAIQFRREDKLKDALWQFPAVTAKERRALQTIRDQDLLIAPVLSVFLQCSRGSGEPPLTASGRKPRTMTDPPGQPHSQRPMEPRPSRDILMNDFARRWFEENTWRWEARGAAQIRSLLLAHIMKDWRTRPVSTVSDPAEIRDWFERLARTGLGRTHLKNIRAIFVMLLHAAQVNDLIEENPFNAPLCSRKAILALARHRHAR